jgi:hypothetical protein
MDRFPFERLTATAATLEAMIYRSLEQELDWRLEHVIRVQLAPLDLDGVRAEPKLTVAGLDLGIRSFRELDQKQYRYSLQPRLRREENEIHHDYDAEGALELPSGLGLVVVEEIDFGAREGLTIPCRLGLELHLDHRPRERVQLPIRLAIGPVIFFGDRAEATAPTREQAEEMAARFLLLSDYQLQLGEKHPRFVPREG